MRIPYQRKLSENKKAVHKFRGLDRRIGAEENSFYDMTNMSGREENCISSRVPRGAFDVDADNIRSFISTDMKIDGELIENVFVAATSSRLKAFYYKDGVLKNKALLSFGEAQAGKSKLIASGGYLYYFPENKYINLMNLSDKGELGVNAALPFGVVDDMFYEIEIKSVDKTGAVAEANSGYVRIASNKYKYYNGTKGDYIGRFNFAYYLREGDYVNVSGNEVIDGLHKIEYVSKSGDYIVVSAVIDSDIVQSDEGLTVSRSVPEMDYVIAAGNRLWGCRYGVDENGKPINEIYASKLGDAKNWYTFEGVSTDSYVASVGVDGVFTGVAVYDGDPLFFKEDHVIRVYGNNPSDFTIITNNIRGIEKGSSESVAMVDDVLYYKTYDGIVAYNGGIPYNVDEALGSENYKNAVAGSRNGEYYVSMENSNGEYELFVYNTASGQWFREDNSKAIGFCRNGSDLYMLVDRGDGKALLSVNGMGDSDGEGSVEWSLCTMMDYMLPYRKALKRLEFKALLDEDARLTVEISYDGEKEWHKLSTSRGKKGIISVPVRPRRCNSFSLRLSGCGGFKLVSIVKAVSYCGDNKGD